MGLLSTPTVAISRGCYRRGQRGWAGPGKDSKDLDSNSHLEQGVSRSGRKEWLKSNAGPNVNDRVEF